MDTTDSKIKINFYTEDKKLVFGIKVDFEEEDLPYSIYRFGALSTIREVIDGKPVKYYSINSKEKRDVLIVEDYLCKILETTLNEDFYMTDKILKLYWKEVISYIRENKENILERDLEMKENILESLEVDIGNYVDRKIDAERIVNLYATQDDYDDEKLERLIYDWLFDDIIHHVGIDIKTNPCRLNVEIQEFLENIDSMIYSSKRYLLYRLVMNEIKTGLCRNIKDDYTSLYKEYGNSIDRILNEYCGI